MIERQKKAQDEAKANLSALSPRIPTLTIEITGGTPDGLGVTIDQRTLSQGNLDQPQELDPGTHTVTVTRSGEQPLSKTVTLGEGERKAAPFELGPSPAIGQASADELPAKPVRPAIVMSPPRGHVTPHQPEQNKASTTRRTVGWVGVGVGAAGLAVGATAAVLAWNTRSKAGCDGDISCDEYDRYHESYNAWRAASTAGFVVGAVGVTTAAVGWLVLKTKSQEPAQVSMTLGRGSVGLRGVF